MDEFWDALLKRVEKEAVQDAEELIHRAEEAAHIGMGIKGFAQPTFEEADRKRIRTFFIAQRTHGLANALAKMARMEILNPAKTTITRVSDSMGPGCEGIPGPCCLSGQLPIT
jgi:hypothetical protein